MAAGRGGGAVPINIRPTHSVSEVFLCYSIILWIIMQVNVPQPNVSVGVSNVRAPSNVSFSV